MGALRSIVLYTVAAVVVPSTVHAAAPKQPKVRMILPQRATPAPVAVVVHGQFVDSKNHESLAVGLAGRGYAVALVDMPRSWLPRPNKWVADTRGVLDRLELRSAAGGDLEGKLNLGNVAVIGQSLGGVVAIGVGAEDARVKRVVALSPGSPFTRRMGPDAGRLSIPALIMVGSRDLVAPGRFFGKVAARRCGHECDEVEVAGGHTGFVDAGYLPLKLRAHLPWKNARSQKREVNAKVIDWLDSYASRIATRGL